MEHTALEVRLNRLEASQARWRCAFLACVAAWAFSCASATAQETPQECRTNQLVLVDSAGAERGLLELDKGQPVLRLVGSNRLVQVQLGVTEPHDGAASPYLQNANQSSFAVLAATSTTGSAGLEMGGDLKRIRRRA